MTTPAASAPVLIGPVSSHPARGFRHLRCASYIRCLDVAVAQSWPGFSCAACPEARGQRLTDLRLVAANRSVLRTLPDGSVMPTLVANRLQDMERDACPRCGVGWGEAESVCPCHKNEELPSDLVETWRSSSLCDDPGCERGVHAKGLCGKHYMHSLQAKPGRVCDEPGCEGAVHGLGLCKRHYLRVQRGRLPQGALAEAL